MARRGGLCQGGERQRGDGLQRHGPHQRQVSHARSGAAERLCLPPLEYNYKYDWLRPTLDEIITAYKKLYGKEQHESDADSEDESAEEEEAEEEGEEEGEPVCAPCPA